MSRESIPAVPGGRVLRGFDKLYVAAGSCRSHHACQANHASVRADGDARKRHRDPARGADAEFQFTNDAYWSFTRASMSHDGSAVLWDSNFGYPNRSEAVAVGLSGFPVIPPPPPDTGVTGAGPCARASDSRSSCYRNSSRRTGLCRLGYRRDWRRSRRSPKY